MTWRPFEPCKDNYPKADDKPQRPNASDALYVQRRLESTRKRTCKLHSDCRAADEMTRAAGGRTVKVGDTEVIVMTAKHE